MSQLVPLVPYGYTEALLSLRVYGEIQQMADVVLYLGQVIADDSRTRCLLLPPLVLLEQIMAVMPISLAGLWIWPVYVVRCSKS